MKKESKHLINERLFGNLDKFRELDPEEDWTKVKQRMGFHSESSINMSQDRRRSAWFWPAAAMIIMILGVGWLTGLIQLTPPHMVVASTGETKEEVLLPDGSLVHLNRNSELSYPEKFGRRSREVSFNGEGYFDVTRHPEKPFVIHISDVAGIEVLGTEFNINTLQDDQTVKVNVVDGSVAFFSSHTPESRTIIKRHEQAVLHEGTINKDKTVDQNFLSWRTGVLSFDQEPLTSVLEDLSRYYDRRLILENPGGETIRFSSVIDNQDLDSVLEEFKLVLGLDHRTEGNTITLYRPD